MSPRREERKITFTLSESNIRRLLESLRYTRKKTSEELYNPARIHQEWRKKRLHNEIDNLTLLIDYIEKQNVEAARQRLIQAVQNIGTGGGI